MNHPSTNASSLLVHFLKNDKKNLHLWDESQTSNYEKDKKLFNEYSFKKEKYDNISLKRYKNFLPILIWFLPCHYKAEMKRQ